MLVKPYKVESNISDLLTNLFNGYKKQLKIVDNYQFGCYYYFRKAKLSDKFSENVRLMDQTSEIKRRFFKRVADAE